MSTPTTAAQIEAEYGIADADFAALSPSIRSLFRAAYAVDVLHVEEIPRGSNRGPDVERYLASCGIGPGKPWCAAFRAAMLMDSGVNRSDLPTRAASVHGWLDWARAGGLIISTPVRGCVGLIIESPTEGHLVSVSHYDPGTRTIDTIEGNTNPGGSRDGYGAFRRTRKVSICRAYVDLGGLTS